MRLYCVHLQVFKEEEEAVKVDLHEGCGRIKLYWTMAVADYRTLKAMIEFRETAGGEDVWISCDLPNDAPVCVCVRQAQRGRVDSVARPATRDCFLLDTSVLTLSARRGHRTRATRPCRAATCAVGSRERRSVYPAFTPVPLRLEES